MTQQANLEKLEVATKAVFENQRAALGKSTTEETRIRKEIDRLTGLASTDAPQEISLKVLRGDILWNAWLNRKKFELNLQLARVLAVKEHHRKKLQESFGRLSAIQDVRKKARIATRKKLLQIELSQTIDDTLT